MPRDSNHNYNVNGPFKSLSLSFIHTHCSFFIYIPFMDGSLLHLVILTANCFTFNEYLFQSILWHCFLFLESHLLSLRQIMLWEGSGIPVIFTPFKCLRFHFNFLTKAKQDFSFFFLFKLEFPFLVLSVKMQSEIKIFFDDNPVKMFVEKKSNRSTIPLACRPHF